MLEQWLYSVLSKNSGARLWYAEVSCSVYTATTAS